VKCAGKKLENIIAGEEEMLGKEKVVVRNEKVVVVPYKGSAFWSRCWRWRIVVWNVVEWNKRQWWWSGEASSWCWRWRNVVDVWKNQRWWSGEASCCWSVVAAPGRWSPKIFGWDKRQWWRSGEASWGQGSGGSDLRNGSSLLHVCGGG
jgi:hypothetical protein